jgi:hypothetical protein
MGLCYVIYAILFGGSMVSCKEKKVEKEKNKGDEEL